jgi:hypothetical protein
MNYYCCCCCNRVFASERERTKKNECLQLKKKMLSEQRVGVFKKHQQKQRSLIFDQPPRRSALHGEKKFARAQPAPNPKSSHFLLCPFFLPLIVRGVRHYVWACVFRRAPSPPYPWFSRARALIHLFGRQIPCVHRWIWRRNKNIPQDEPSTACTRRRHCFWRGEWVIATNSLLQLGHHLLLSLGFAAAAISPLQNFYYHVPRVLHLLSHPAASGRSWQ